MTPKQTRFVAEYLVDLNATQAAIRAGYSQRTAASIGAENLRKPNIAAVIEAARARLAEKAEVTREWIIDRLRHNAVQCLVPGDSFNPAAANKALELLGKEHKMFIDRRLLGVRNIDDMTEEEILEFLGGEPEAEELRKAAGAHPPSHA